MRLWTTLTRSRRRSSVRGGILSRTTVPSTLGVRPMSLLRIAFRWHRARPGPHGWMTIWWGSGTEMPASCEGGWACRSTRHGCARRGRRCPPRSNPLEVALHGVNGARHLRFDRCEGLAAHAAPPPEMRVPTCSPEQPRMLSGRFQVEDDDRKVVLHAERHRGRVQHGQAAGEDIAVGECIVASGARVLHRIRVVDAVHLGGLEEDLRPRSPPREGRPRCPS